MRRRVIILLCCTLMSCSSLGVATTVAKGVLGDGPSVALDTQVGDKTANLGSTENKQITVDENEGSVVVSTSTATNVDNTTLFLIALGWFVPGPVEVYNGFEKRFIMIFKEIKSWFKKT